MIEQAFIELMHREIDSEISPSERQNLRDYLQASSEARAYYERLVRLAAEFTKSPQVEAPVGLKQSIMTQIGAYHHNRAPHTQSSSKPLKEFFKTLFGSPVFLLSSGAVAGA